MFRKLSLPMVCILSLIRFAPADEPKDIWYPIGPWTAGGPVVAIDAGNPDVLYTAVRDIGVFSSTDGGTNWNFVSQSLDIREMVRELGVLAVDPVNPGILYVNRRYGAGYRTGEILKSTDGGRTWALLPPAPGTGYLWSLTVDATNPLVLYAAGVSWKGTEFERFSLYRTTDGGASWTSLGYPPEDFVIFSGPLVDPSDPSVMYTVGSGRLYIRRGSGYWEKSGLDLPAISGLAASPKLPGYVFATTVDGVYRSTDTGQTWVKSTSIGLSDLPVSNLVIHPATGALYAWQSGLVKSTDQGANWVRRGGSVPGTFFGMTIDRFRPEIVYVSTSDNLFKSTDEGASWTTGGRVVGRPVYNITADPLSQAVFMPLRMTAVSLVLAD